MERSQSCSNFNLNNSNCCNNNQTNNSSMISLTSLSTSTQQLHKKRIGLRQLQQLQQHQQQQHQQHHQQQLLQQHHQQKLLKHASSSDSVISAALLQRLTMSPLALRRAKTLQRNKSIEFMDVDMDYAADHEEDCDDDDDDVDDDDDNDNDINVVNNNDDIKHDSSNSKNNTTTILPYHTKHARFSKHKPQSESALLVKQMSTTSLGNHMLLHNVIGNHHHHHHHNNGLITSPANILSASMSVNDISPQSKRQQFALLKRDNSIQSDSSRYSSVDSLLEARKPDPEAILINLGFCPPGSEDILSRIPKRFLKPSQVRGIDTDAFVKRLQLASTLADHSVLGYRGLTGNPDIPPSSIVAKIMQRFEVNQRKKSMGSAEHTIR